MHRHRMVSHKIIPKHVPEETISPYPCAPKTSLGQISLSIFYT